MRHSWRKAVYSKAIIKEHSAAHSPTPPCNLTPFVAAILALGGRLRLSRSIMSVPFGRSRVNAHRWPAARSQPYAIVALTETLSAQHARPRSWLETHASFLSFTPSSTRLLYFTRLQPTTTSARQRNASYSVLGLMRFIVCRLRTGNSF